MMALPPILDPGDTFTVEVGHPVMTPLPSRGPMNRTVRPVIIAIDGPAGSGKSSISAEVAARLGFGYLNTGAIYRAVGLLAVERGIDLSRSDRLAELAAEVTPHLRWRDETRELYFKDRNLTPLLGSEEAGYGASKIATAPTVRTSLLPIQRQLALSASRGALVDGRDIGTVVFPDADLKVFLTASLEARSRRRLRQLGSELDQETDRLDAIRDGIAKRDAQDSGREVAPLRQADDAMMLDTSDLTLDETISALLALIRERGLAR